MILKLHGHIGSSVSALVDGQLSTQDEERAWAHVMTCPGCRRLVEREGWVKTRLASLSSPCTPAGASSGLLGSLYDVDAWATADELERHSSRRRVALVAVGAGSVGAAVLGLVAFTGGAAGNNELPGDPPPASINADLASPAATPKPSPVGTTTRTTK